MPYNTRRKSVSLVDLGIIVPKRSRTVSHPAPPPNTLAEADQTGPAVKKPKRSHDSASPSAGLMSPPRATAIRVKADKPKRATELSPPPSPGVTGSNKVDVEGISDEIVVETIRQLEKTGNRPHLVKELGAVLATHLQAVERSANPSALISARITAYLNRSWPAVSPCPLAKDLTVAHPRRLYFYLTTMPRQPVPDISDTMAEPSRVISPALSSASAADEEERISRKREVPSPSPEVDLSAPELDDETQDNTTSFPSRSSIPRDNSNTSSFSHNRRAASPQLEHEERDFKQTANALYERAQQRRNSQTQQGQQQDKENDTTTDQRPPSLSRSSTDPSEGYNDNDSVAMSIEGNDSEESVAAQTSSDVAALFGHNSSHSHMQMEFSSPLILAQGSECLQLNTLQFSPKPQQPRGLEGIQRRDEVLEMDDIALDSKRPAFEQLELPDAKMEMELEFDGWDALQSPENVELDELDGMFDSY